MKKQKNMMERERLASKTIINEKLLNDLCQMAVSKSNTVIENRKEKNQIQLQIKGKTTQGSECIKIWKGLWHWKVITMKSLDKYGNIESFKHSAQSKLA